MPELNRAISNAFSEYCSARITEFSPVSGGCISNAFLCETDQGRFFIKVNGSCDESMFAAEMAGLEALNGAGKLRAPRPQCFGALEGGGSFLIMEYIELHSGGASKSQELLGRGLAQMHLSALAERYGFECDNTIGSTLQKNTWTEEWCDFYGKYRLGFQLDLAKKVLGKKDPVLEKGDVLLASFPRFFDGLSVFPSLLHGDLWGGNMAADKGGAPVIFDPATYYGHHEAELSIMGMFGGFSDSFYRAYHEIIPKSAGFDERHDLYTLYHYLNHFNLFGDGYYQTCLAIIERLIADFP